MQTWYSYIIFTNNLKYWYILFSSLLILVGTFLYIYIQTYAHVRCYGVKMSGKLEENSKGMCEKCTDMDPQKN